MCYVVWKFTHPPNNEDVILKELHWKSTNCLLDYKSSYLKVCLLKFFLQNSFAIVNDKPWNMRLILKAKELPLLLPAFHCLLNAAQADLHISAGPYTNPGFVYHL